MGRPPCCEKLNVKRSLWSAHEDTKMLAHGTGNSWSTTVTKKAGNRKCGKSCRVKSNNNNYSKNDDKQDKFTAEDEELIVRLHSAIGSRWSIIAQQLPGKTDIDIKTLWNTKLRKKLSDIGIDPVTHKPISQILVDYGNISGLTKPLINNNNNNNTFVMSSASKASPSVGIELNNNNNNNSLMDLLDQLQAIKSVANAYKQQEQPQYYLNETSSVYNSNVAWEKSPTTSFNWQDFLLEDVFLQQADYNGEENNLKSMNVMTSDDGGGCSGYFAPESDNCFVETMLDRENEMLMECLQQPNDHQ